MSILLEVSILNKTMFSLKNNILINYFNLLRCIAKDNIRNLHAVVHATTLGITVPYELPAEVSNVCDNLMYGAMCPIDKTEDVVYEFNFYVEAHYPEISVSVQVSLEDEEGDSIACFVCSIKVKKGSTNTFLLE